MTDKQPSWSLWRSLWRVAVVAVPIFAFVGLLIAAVLLRGERNALQTWQDQVIAATQEAAGPPPVLPDTIILRLKGLAPRTYAPVRASVAPVPLAPSRVPVATQARRASAQATRREAPRAAIRRGIMAPRRETGLTEAEWSQL